jgi:phosphatidylserine/phosphatidylglycerophosphate/cardiolipin synthase-like enzyme/membrane protein DedA with SNARE-associated domain
MKRITREGHNCWRLERADRAAFLVDAGPYYEALASALERAERQVVVLGWDIDSRVRLRRGGGASAQQSELRRLLNAVVSRRPELEVYLLSWDYALIYALERERVPLYNLELRTHRRVHFHLDDRHPPGASHHQKVVVIDDGVAFAGGIDLTCHRWDTPRHGARDPRRVNPDGQAFAPFHDAQIAVSGDAARALGELARERWRVATGQVLEAPAVAPGGWPPGLRPDVTDIEVAVARTLPASGQQGEVREVERLFLDTIAGARRTIYIENQYLTATTVRDALARRLREEEGPEVIIVGPRQASGWLESSTMDVLRGRLLDRLRAADRHGRLGVYYPRLEPSGEAVYVHAKVMVADDEIARVGSANLANRSMGLDSECDLAIEAAGRPDVRAAIRGLRERLLAEHLGVDAASVAEAHAARGSLGGAIERFRGTGERDLVPLDLEIPEWLDRMIPERPPFDPPAPLEPEEVLAQLVPEEIQRGSRRPLLRGALLLAALLLLAATWRWTPMGEWIDPLVLSRWAEPIRGSWIEPLAAIATFVVGGSLMFPLTVLVLYTVLVFGSFAGLAYAFGGALASAWISFALGRRLGRRAVRRISGSHLDRISRGLARGGILGVVVVRLIPVAPFTVVNLVAGASRFKSWEFLAGTAVGLLPGMIALTLLGDRVEAAIEDPSVASVAGVAVTAAAIVAAAALLSRRLKRRSVGETARA